MFMRNRAFLGQVKLVGHPSFPTSRALGQATKCWRTVDGGTVCDDGLYYLPG